MGEWQVIGIAGAGFMGRQIALHCAYHGYRVNVYDVSEEVLEKASVENEAALSLGRYRADTEEKKNEVLGRIKYATDFNDTFSGVDMVVEAVPERLELKREVWARLDEVCPPHAVIGTNSSSMKVSWLEDATSRPEKVLNTHFASPIPERYYVELMGGSKTSQETMEKAKEWVVSIGCVPLAAKKEIMGFVVNRLWHAVKKEALKMWAGGYADIEDIDRGWMIFSGMKAGPFGGMDYVGLDVVHDIEMAYYRESGNPEDNPPDALREKIERGELGMKAGKGFYENNDLKYLKPDFLKPGKG